MINDSCCVLDGGDACYDVPTGCSQPACTGSADYNKQFCCSKNVKLEEISSGVYHWICQPKDRITALLW